MELRQLEYFLAVVEEGSFTRAASRLYMVQSSLSASLLGLERELGTDLFIRGRRGTELTDAGRALVAHARSVLDEIAHAHDDVAGVRGLIRGSVRVATVAVPGEVNVLHTIRRFRHEHPGVVVYVIHDGAQDLAGMVADGQVDFAITPLTRDSSPTLLFEPLLSTPLVLLCPGDHPLAQAQSVEPRQILDETIIDYPRGWWVRELFDRLFYDRRLPRQVRVEMNEWFGVLTMIQSGLGVSYGPRECVDEAVFDDIACATLPGAPSWDLGIVTRDEALRGAAGRSFLASYRQQCQKALAGMSPHPEQHERAGEPDAPSL